MLLSRPLKAKGRRFGLFRGRREFGRATQASYGGGCRVVVCLFIVVVLWRYLVVVVVVVI